MKLPKAYNPSHYESDIYELWEKSGAFIAHPESTKEHFSISMPPPNETGTLSLGHALFLTLQDIMDLYPERQFMKADGFDDAVIGFDPNTDRLIYDRYEMVQILVREEMSEEDENHYVQYRC